MSKRGMATQGGEERYGSMGESNMQGEDDKPRQATAAQLARRKILSAKGIRPGGSNRNSRAGSPAVPGGNPFAQTQTFQPPPSTNGFSFNVGGLAPAPAFGQTPQSNGNMFGTPAQDQSQQNGGTSFGGFGSTQGSATPSFGSGFGSTSNNSQTQQNGFNPPTSFSFGQSQNTAVTPATSSSFGQTANQAQTSQQAQTNGFKPNTNSVFGNSFGGSQTKENGATAAFSFGQSQATQEQTPKPNASAFGGFGQQTQTSGDSSASTSVFANVPGGEKQIGGGLFGSTPAPEPAKSSDSIFSAMKPATNGIKPGMFTQSQENCERTPKPFSFGLPANKPNEETPKPIFSFGQPAEKRDEQQTPKPASAFTFGQPAARQSSEETLKASNPFSGFSSQSVQNSSASQPSETNQTAKAAVNTFSASEPTDPKLKPAFSFGIPPPEDASMMSVNNTPQKTSSYASSALAASTEDQSNTNANAGKDLFSRISRPEPPATAPRPSFASAQSFGGSFGNPDAPNGATAQTAGKDLFSRLSYPEPPATEPRPSSSNVGNFATNTAPSAAVFAPTTTKMTPVASKGLLQPPKASSKPRTMSKSGSDLGNLTQLNEGFLAHLKNEDPGKDWSVICQHYLKLAAKYTGQQSVTGSSVTSTSQPSSMFAATETPKAPSNNIFDMQASSSIMFKPQTAQFPAAAPVSKKRAADEELTKDQTSPTTEKRSKPNNDPIQYPALPETASSTAKLFASTLDKPIERPSGASSFGPPKDVMDKVREQKAAKEAAEKSTPNQTFKPAASTSFTSSTTFTPSTTLKLGDTVTSAIASQKVTEAPKAPVFGFKPSMSTSTAPTLGFKPPNLGAAADGSSNNFLAAFGKKASTEEEKARKRRKDEDYDSDDGDEAEWEARDKAEQEAKRRKIEEAAKTGPQFKFPAIGDKPSTSSTPFAFKLPGERKDPVNDTSQLTPRQNSSFPDLPTESLFTAPKVDPTSSGPLFGVLGKTLGESQQGSGDKTWKPTTSINWDTQDTRLTRGGGLFGTPAPAATDSAKLAPPSMGFNFGQKAGASGISTADGSRATTPGLTTDGEASTNGEAAEATEAGEPNEEAKDPQIEDMTALLPEELEVEEVIAQATMAKASKYDDKNTEDGMKKAWIERGKGPLYVLKNKSTGKVRILLKVPPLGRLAMNFEPLKGVEYKNSRPKFVTGPFIDHLETNKEKVPGIKTWQIQVREPAEAEKIAQALMDGRPS